MNYGEGYRTLQRLQGKELRSKLRKMDGEEVNQLKEGDRIVHLGNRRVYQWTFEVTGFGVNYWDEIIVKLNRLTPTGKLSKAKNATVKFKLDDLKYDAWEYFEGATTLVQNYLEETKKPVATGKMRDYQRQKVYDTERKVGKELGRVHFNDHDEAEEFCNDIVRSRYVEKMFPDLQFGKTVTLRQNKKMNFVWVYSGRQLIEYNPNRKNALTKYVMIHEVAHIFAPNDEHGSEFATSYLILLNEFYPEFFKRLRSIYDAHGVDYNKEKINSL